MNKIIDLKLLKFLTVGLVNTVLGTAIMFCLYNLVGCSYWLSSATNYISISILSYFLNKKFTFKFKGAAVRSGFRFALNIAVCYFIAYGVAKPMIEHIMDGSTIYLQDNMAMIVGMIIFTAINYLGQRFFVFGDIPMNAKKQYHKWINSPYIEENEKELLAKMSEDEIHEAFYKHAEFGTSGMREVMGLGTNRLNKYTIRMAAKGMAELLGPGSKVAIAYDTRNNSRVFAEESAKVLAASNIKVYLFDRYSPVPLLSFAVRELECDGGIAITASHNTKEYNGFKAYDDTGCQMGPEMAGYIAENIRRLDNELDVETTDLNDPNIEYIGEDIVRKFNTAACACGVDIDEAAAESLNIVYSPLHGSGRDYVMQVLKNAGFKNLKLVEEQAGFNGDFPTIKKPNPEYQSAFSIAESIALESEADIIIATDPDCDRIGVGVRNNNSIAYFSGNQIGALMIDFLAKYKLAASRKLVTTIVSSEMGTVVAKAHGINVKETLTGFKYIGDEMNRMNQDEFFMAYEESYGYLVGTHSRDKDAVSAAVVICQMAAHYKAQGMTLINALERLSDKYGHYIDTQESFTFEGSKGAEKIKAIMSSLREDGEFAFSEVAEMKAFKDYSKGIDGLPPANVFKYIFKNGSWIAVRPSGTEPKIKFYYCIKGDDAFSAQRMYDKLKKSVTILIKK